MKTKRLSSAKMAEIDAQIAQEKELLEREKQRLCDLQINGLDFSASTINEDLALWIKSGKKLSIKDKREVVKGVLNRENISSDILIAMLERGYLFSGKMVAMLLRHVIEKKLSVRVVELLRKNNNLCGGEDDVRAQIWLLIECVKQKIIPKREWEDLLESKIFLWSYVQQLILMRRLDGQMVSDILNCGIERQLPVLCKDEIISDVIEGKTLLGVLRKMVKMRYVFSGEELYLVVRGVLNGKIPEDILCMILEASCKCGSGCLYAAKNLLVNGLCEGKLSAQCFNCVLRYNGVLNDDDWKKLYDSQRDFLVRAYVRKFYPFLKIKI